MGIIRPMPIILLKKCFIKVLSEQMLDGQLLPYQAIFGKVPDFFQIEPLSSEELARGKGAVKELERDGYIQRVVGIRFESYKLTRKALKITNQDIERMSLPKVDLIELLSPRHDLIKKVYDDYLVGDYESAIFNAYKLLEVSVRKKAELPLSDNVSKLMADAFKPDCGRLKYPDRETPGEQQGIQLLMAGAIMFFKSPRSHRTVILEDPNTVMNVLAFARFLLDLTDKCELIQSIEK